MDARKMSAKVITEAIKQEQYVITGFTESGEVTLTLISKLDKKFIKKILETDVTAEEKLQAISRLLNVKGRDAQEYMQIYLQSRAAVN